VFLWSAKDTTVGVKCKVNDVSTKIKIRFEWWTVWRKVYAPSCKETLELVCHLFIHHLYTIRIWGFIKDKADDPKFVEYDVGADLPHGRFGISTTLVSPITNLRQSKWFLIKPKKKKRKTCLWVSAVANHFCEIISGE
jgi:hypothetical protein